MANTTTHTGSTPDVIPEQQKILIIDNNSAHTGDIINSLTEASYNVHVEQIDTTILRHVQRTRPDLVILALDKPDAGALTICQQLKHHEDSGFLPVIMVAAKADANHRLDFVRTGTDDYLVQPIARQEFLARVDTLLAIRQRFNKLLAVNRRLTHELAERNEQLEEALQTAHELDLFKTAIIRNVNHELRTPLLQVKSSVSLLKEDLPDNGNNDSGSANSLINMATQAIDRLEDTVTSVAQLVESQNINLEPANLNECVHLAIHQLKRSNRFSEQEYNRINLCYSKRLPLVLGDKRGIAQVLLHLLDNALKFSPKGGPVDILIGPQDDGTVYIGVRDQGIGIPAGKLPRIFESFYQVDTSSTRSFGGVGVGLTLANMILRQMDSTLQVKSKPRSGSEFFFLLLQATLPD